VLGITINKLPVLPLPIQMINNHFHEPLRRMRSSFKQKLGNNLIALGISHNVSTKDRNNR
jgi:hypothetical protein